MTTPKFEYIEGEGYSLTGIDKSSMAILISGIISLPNSVLALASPQFKIEFSKFMEEDTRRLAREKINSLNSGPLTS